MTTTVSREFPRGLPVMREGYDSTTPVNAKPARVPTIATWSCETWSSIHG